LTGVYTGQHPRYNKKDIEILTVAQVNFVAVIAIIDKAKTRFISKILKTSNQKQFTLVAVGLKMNGCMDF
jgi:hypothetical protein